MTPVLPPLIAGRWPVDTLVYLSAEVMHTAMHRVETLVDAKGGVRVFTGCGWTPSAGGVHQLGDVVILSPHPCVRCFGLPLPVVA